MTGKASAFLFQRLKPGIILTINRGRDTGEFGAAPLQVIEREHALFGRPVQWFIDACRADSATMAVSDRWTSWLREHSGVVGQLHVLTSGAETRMMIDLARHFSDASKRMALYSDRAQWEAALLRLIPSPGLGLAERFDEESIEVKRIVAGDGEVSVNAPYSRWSFRELPNNAIFSKFSGLDTGDLTDAALDEMERLLGPAKRKASWFLDLRDAQSVAASVSQTWTEYLTARSGRFTRVVAYAPSPLFPLVLTIAKYKSGTEHLLRVHREVGPFREELAGVTSMEMARSVGV